MLPKIHKDPAAWSRPSEIPPGRPIVSDCSSETYNTAEYLDHYVPPLYQARQLCEGHIRFRPKGQRHTRPLALHLVHDGRGQSLHQ